MSECMTPPSTKPMQCINCGMRITATMQQAKRHGWQLWVGGSRCKRCVEDQQTPIQECFKCKQVKEIALWPVGYGPACQECCEDAFQKAGM